jgi:hypothetical protein
VIRIVALGAVCLAGLGAIAAVPNKSPPPQPAEVIFPVVAGNKADRQQLVIDRDTPTVAERVDVVYVPPVEDLTPSNQSALQKAASPPAPRIASRHWHDPHDRKFFEATKQNASKSKSPTKDTADRAPKRATAVRECRSDGLDPFLRKLNLSPQCE